MAAPPWSVSTSYGCCLIRRWIPGQIDHRISGGWQSTTARNLLQIRLLIFILIASVFWAVLNQLWDMLPNFIVDWVDSASLARHLPGFLLSRNTSRGPQLAQEWVINLNPLLIIFLVAPLSWYVNQRLRRLTSIFFGCLIVSLGIYLAGASRSIYLCLAGIACFSIGEMLCSPKMTEYLGVIAPPDQKALYMGYANIPLAIGWGYGSFVGGQIYEHAGEKAGLALRYLSEVLQVHDTAGTFPGLCHPDRDVGSDPGPGNPAFVGNLRPQPGLDTLCFGGPLGCCGSFSL